MQKNNTSTWTCSGGFWAPLDELRPAGEKSSLSPQSEFESRAEPSALWRVVDETWSGSSLLSTMSNQSQGEYGSIYLSFPVGYKFIISCVQTEWVADVRGHRQSQMPPTVPVSYCRGPLINGKLFDHRCCCLLIAVEWQYSVDAWTCLLRN